MRSFYKSYHRYDTWIKHLIWFVYQYSGLRLIWHTIKPPVKTDGLIPPSSFFIRFFSSYLILYGLAFNRYELSVSSFESVYASLIEELGSHPSESTLQEIVNLQSQPFPELPSLNNPIGVISTITRNNSNYKPIINRVARLVERQLENMDSLTIWNLKGSSISFKHRKAIYLYQAEIGNLHTEGANISINNSDIDQLFRF